MFPEKIRICSAGPRSHPQPLTKFWNSINSEHSPSNLCPTIALLSSDPSSHVRQVGLRLSSGLAEPNSVPRLTSGPSTSVHSVWSCLVTQREDKLFSDPLLFVRHLSFDLCSFKKVSRLYSVGCLTYLYLHIIIAPLALRLLLLNARDFPSKYYVIKWCHPLVWGN